MEWKIVAESGDCRNKIRTEISPEPQQHVPISGYCSSSENFLPIPFTFSTNQRKEWRDDSMIKSRLFVLATARVNQRLERDLVVSELVWIYSAVSINERRGISELRVETGELTNKFLGGIFIRLKSPFRAGDKQIQMCIVIRNVFSFMCIPILKCLLSRITYNKLRMSLLSL